jgi:hypothetical protein
MFQAKYFHTSRTDYTYQGGFKVIEAKCDVDVNLCYDNTQAACSGTYHVRYLGIKVETIKVSTSRPCRRAGVFPEQCITNGMGGYYDVIDEYSEQYQAYTLISECKDTD